MKWSNTYETNLSNPEIQGVICTVVVMYDLCMFLARKCSRFLEEMVSNRYGRGTSWMWYMSHIELTEGNEPWLQWFLWLSCLFRILIQSRPSWSLGWLKWARPCCPSSHHSWSPVIRKWKYVPLPVLGWLAQKLGSSVPFVEIITFSASNPGSLFKGFMLKTMQVGMDTCVAILLRNGSNFLHLPQELGSFKGVI